MKALLAVLGLLFVSVSASAESVRLVDKATAATVQNHVDIAWSWACLLQGVNCRNVPKPVVNFTDELDLEMQGSYWYGTATVNVALVFFGDPYEIVLLVHEMMHYLQWIEGGHAPSYRSMKCLREKEAFANDAKVAKYLGLDTHPHAFKWEQVEAAYGCSPNPLFKR